MQAADYEAVILDLDGVITRTASLHARAWKRMFDEYLDQRGQRDGRPYAPFDIESDYFQYVDGKPRYDGVRSFLQSRQIQIPDGSPDDPPGKETAGGLGNRKNEIFQQLLHEQPAEIFPDAIEQIEVWRRHGLKTAVVSSSKNCGLILKSAGLVDLFDTKVDGQDGQRLGLPGKPAPDLFLEAAQRLGVDPARAIVIEDAIAGVEAGRAGGFATVVGVARERDPEPLRRAGADMVVQDLREVKLFASESAPEKSRPRSALGHRDWIATQLDEHELALFLDYDGTLTPIVRHPSEATLSDDVRQQLRQLATRCTVAVVSGRDRGDVKNMVGLDEIIYAGSHGFDISGPDGLHMEHDKAQAALPELDQAEDAVRGKLADVNGAWIERKRFAVAVHYREVADADAERVEQLLEELSSEHQNLRQLRGKKVFELQPNVEWDKGRAVLWLLDALNLDRSHVLTIYIGDDTTDEDAFAALQTRDLGLGIYVGPSNGTTKARYYVRDCDEVKQFLAMLHDILQRKATGS